MKFQNSICIFILFSILVNFVSANEKLNYPADTYRNFTQIIQAKGYPVETHEVLTTDGYVLTVFRIPNPNKPPILLQHGLIDSSFTWILNFPSESLPYILSDQGYDVWMGNNRGTVYSLQNIHFPTNTPQFWNFSFDEFAAYDVPAMIDYILNETDSQQLAAYVGHSQGTMQMFAALSSQQPEELADKINLFVALGPVATVKYITNKFLRLLAAIDLGQFLQFFGEERFLPPFSTIEKFLPFVCETDPNSCADVIELLCGKHKGAFNNSRMPVVSTHEPGGTSVKDMIHFTQEVKSGLFQMYNYGTQGNMIQYGQPTAPIYNVENISYSPARKGKKFPIFLVSGGADELADPKDVQALTKLLDQNPNLSVTTQFIPNYAHLDFVWAIDAHTIVYPNIIELLQSQN